jgi:ubiquinone/menaquinone biosynthesis C-methylase UbiE
MRTFGFPCGLLGWLGGMILARTNRRVELRQASAEHMPFPDGSFDKALAVNSMQLWPDVPAGLHELSRVLRQGGRVAQAFTTYSGQQREGMDALLASAGFRDCRIVETNGAFCLLASAPRALSA